MRKRAANNGEDQAVPPTPEAASGPVADAYQRGLAEGRQLGREEFALEREGLAAREAILERARADLERRAGELEASFREEREALIKGAQLQLVELAVLVAERLLRAQLKLAPDTVIRVAREALGEIRGEPAVRLRAGPEDVPLLREALDGLAGEAGVSELEVIPQSDLDQGELEVETSSGTLDGRWSSQLACMRQGLSRPITGEEGP